jgi:ferrous iron transport protein B
VQTAPIHVHPPGALLALVGNPNCGKTALFNRLTGSRQKVANYAGVTVERKEGRLHRRRRGEGCACWTCPAPTACAAQPRRAGHPRRAGRHGHRREAPRPVVCVVDATNLRRNLRLVLAVQRLGLPMRGGAEHGRPWPSSAACAIDPRCASPSAGRAGGRTVATSGRGVEALRRAAGRSRTWALPPPQRRPCADDPAADATGACRDAGPSWAWTTARGAEASDRIDRVGAAPGDRPAAAGGAAVPDVPGRVRLGRGADGLDRGRHRLGG